VKEAVGIEEVAGGDRGWSPQLPSTAKTRGCRGSLAIGVLCGCGSPSPLGSGVAQRLRGGGRGARKEGSMRCEEEAVGKQ
jgi:hypothetical protein